MQFIILPKKCVKKTDSLTITNTLTPSVVKFNSLPVFSMLSNSTFLKPFKSLYYSTVTIETITLEQADPYRPVMCTCTADCYKMWFNTFDLMESNGILPIRWKNSAIIKCNTWVHNISSVQFELNVLSLSVQLGRLHIRKMSVIFRSD